MTKYLVVTRVVASKMVTNSFEYDLALDYRAWLQILNLRAIVSQLST